MELKFEVGAKVQQPIAEVWDAVVNPEKLTRYFTTGGASAPLREGTTVTWSFADTPDKAGGGPVSFPVRVTKVVPEQLIRLEWRAAEGDYQTKVEMRFEALGPKDTMVTISESGWKDTEPGLAESYSHCGGWMNMACCLKADLEYGVQLRKGFF
jgi:uncharacterized protein YndB with AHSA1/START domain